MKYLTTISLITLLNVTAMAKEIKTEIVINATPSKVWSILTNFDNYPNWNPFIKSLRGEVKVGNKITARIEPPGAKGMTFKPTILTYETNKELSWLGHLFIAGLFDGQHKFELIDNRNGTTTFIQSEKFSGILLPLFKKMLDTNTINGFNAMNNKLKELAEQEYEKSAPDSNKIVDDKKYTKIVTIVKVKAPWYAANFLINKEFKKVNAIYEKVDGLLFKAYSINHNEKGKNFGGIYLWKNEDKANNWFTPKWFKDIEIKRGTSPTVEYYKAIADTSYLPFETNYSKVDNRSFVLFLKNLSKDKIKKYYQNQNGVFRIFYIQTENENEGLLMFFYTKHQAIDFVIEHNESNYKLFKVPLLLENKELKKKYK